MAPSIGRIRTFGLIYGLHPVVRTGVLGPRGYWGRFIIFTFCSRLVSINRQPGNACGATDWRLHAIWWVPGSNPNGLAIALSVGPGPMRWLFQLVRTLERFDIQ